MTSNAKQALVLLAEGFEEIEALTAVDVLRRADIDVVTASLDSLIVMGAHQIAVQCDATLTALMSTAFNAVILPGGMPGASHLAASGDVRRLCQATHKAGGIVAAICAAPGIVLPATGLLDGRRATCYPGMEHNFPASAIYIADAPVIVDSGIVTSRGPGTALAFALTLVELMAGRLNAERLSAKMLVTPVTGYATCNNQKEG